MQNGSFSAEISDAEDDGSEASTSESEREDPEYREQTQRYQSLLLHTLRGLAVGQRFDDIVESGTGMSHDATDDGDRSSSGHSCTPAVHTCNGVPQAMPVVSTRRLFLMGCAAGVTDSDLYQTFSEYGSIELAEVFYHPDSNSSMGMAALIYEQEAAAARALVAFERGVVRIPERGMAGAIVDDATASVLVVDPGGDVARQYYFQNVADSQQPAPQASGLPHGSGMRHAGAAYNGTTLLVATGLPLTVTELDLQLFRRFGNLIATRLHCHPLTRRSLGVANLTFEDPASVLRAIQACEAGDQSLFAFGPQLKMAHDPHGGLTQELLTRLVGTACGPDVSMGGCDTAHSTLMMTQSQPMPQPQPMYVGLDDQGSTPLLPQQQQQQQQQQHDWDVPSKRPAREGWVTRPDNMPREGRDGMRGQRQRTANSDLAQRRDGASLSRDDPRSSRDDPRASRDDPRTSRDDPRTSRDDPRTSRDDPRSCADEPRSVREASYLRQPRTASDGDGVSEAQRLASSEQSRRHARCPCTCSSANGGSMQASAALSMHEQSGAHEDRPASWLQKRAGASAGGQERGSGTELGRGEHSRQASTRPERDQSGPTFREPSISISARLMEQPNVLRLSALGGE